MHLSLYPGGLHGIIMVSCSTSLVSFYDRPMERNKICSLLSSSTSRHEPIHMPISVGNTILLWKVRTLSCPQNRELSYYHMSDSEAATSELSDLNICQYRRCDMSKTQKTKYVIG